MTDGIYGLPRVSEVDRVECIWIADTPRHALLRDDFNGGATLSPRAMVPGACAGALWASYDSPRVAAVQAFSDTIEKRVCDPKQVIDQSGFAGGMQLLAERLGIERSRMSPPATPRRYGRHGQPGIARSLSREASAPQDSSLLCAPPEAT
jgi:hypothetical protein